MDGELVEGRRLINYVWYRNVAAGPELAELTTDIRGFECPVSIHPGAVQQRYVDEMRASAAVTLAPAVAEVIATTAAALRPSRLRHPDPRDGGRSGRDHR